MSNDKTVVDRLFKLQAKINMMVVDGKRNAWAVADVLQQIIDEKQPQYLRYVQTITLAPTKGRATLAEAKTVFTGWIDEDFKTLDTDVSGEDTNETMVNVCEIIRDGSYGTFFASLGDPHKLVLTQGQIEEFCRSHRDSLWQEGLAACFLFEVRGMLFVASVGESEDGELTVKLDDFNHDFFWLASFDHLRLVVKQQRCTYSML